MVSMSVHTHSISMSGQDPFRKTSIYFSEEEAEKLKNKIFGCHPNSRFVGGKTSNEGYYRMYGEHKGCLAYYECLKKLGYGLNGEAEVCKIEDSTLI
jgi:hypothetical protein